MLFLGPLTTVACVYKKRRTFIWSLYQRWSISISTEQNKVTVLQIIPQLIHAIKQLWDCRFRQTHHQISGSTEQWDQSFWDCIHKKKLVGFRLQKNANISFYVICKLFTLGEGNFGRNQQCSFSTETVWPGLGDSLYLWLPAGTMPYMRSPSKLTRQA